MPITKKKMTKNAMMKTSNFIAFDFNFFIANLIIVGCLLVIISHAYQQLTNSLMPSTLFENQKNSSGFLRII